jgi:two-component system alkaline phosphatase synthesis response regulator PhoP
MKKVLIVDDDPNIGEFLKHYLRERAEVSIALSVEVGINVLEESMPDVIVLDIMMPIESGLVLLSYIKKRAFSKNPKIIVYTGINTKSLPDLLINNPLITYLIPKGEARNLYTALNKLVYE